MKKIALLVSLSCLSFTMPVFAQTQEDVSKGSWRYSGHVSMVGIDSEVAKQEGIEDSAISIGLFADYKKTNWVTSLGLDFIMYDDNEEFSQTVETVGIFNNGDISDESSDASAVQATVATGYEWRYGVNQDIALLLQGGYGHVFSSERTIPNCTDCRTVDIDVDGGVFAKLMLTKETERWGFSLYAQPYLTGDGLSNSLGFVFSNKF